MMGEKKKKKKGGAIWWERVRPYVMVGPCMIFLAVFTVYPVLNMIYLSFFDYNLLTEKKYKIGRAHV